MNYENTISDYGADTISKPIETLKLTARIQDELFGLRDLLSPVMIVKDVESDGAKPGMNTPLISELENIVQIIQTLKRDIRI